MWFFLPDGSELVPAVGRGAMLLSMKGRAEGPDMPLAAVAAAQLACNLAGLVVALRRRHAYDIPFFRGNAHHVGREALYVGTAMSAPGPMLVAHAVMTGVVASRGSAFARQGLAVLGAMNTGGYLVERLVRHRLRSWDPVETPIVAAGLSLAGATALLGSRRR